MIALVHIEQILQRMAQSPCSAIDEARANSVLSDANIPWNRKFENCLKGLAHQLDLQGAQCA
jgi:hypothetical protein